MQNKYCLPIIALSWDEIAQKIETNKPNYGYFELWLDYVDNLEVSAVKNLLEKYPGRIILVFRRQNLEPIKMPVEKRRSILQAAVSSDCLVDFDITCQTEDLDYAAENGIQLKKIVSFHNYNETPSDGELAEKTKQIESYGPYIIKLSTYCNSKEDALRLLELERRLAKENKQHIVLGMGENGQITRVFATLWGNALAFVPENTGEESAKGQITREKFEKIMKELEE